MNRASARLPGEVSFREVTYQDAEPLIDPTLFDKAQTLLAERGEAYDRRMREAHPDYLLTGLIVCGQCGRSYVGVAAAGRGHRYRYYACWTRQRYGKDACTGERMRADVIRMGGRERCMSDRARTNWSKCCTYTS